MTDISQAAKERAVELANDEIAQTNYRPYHANERSLAANPPLTALAKYIDKVSGIAKEAVMSNTVASGWYREILLKELILTDVDPLADALWGTSVSLKSNCERDAKELRNALAKAGYKIVKDEG